MFTRYTITLTADVQEEVQPDTYSGPRIELHLTKTGVRLVPGVNDGLKIASVETKMTPGGMTEEEYMSKLHKQIHKDHEDDEGKGGGGIGNQTTH